MDHSLNIVHTRGTLVFDLSVGLLSYDLPVVWLLSAVKMVEWVPSGAAAAAAAASVCEVFSNT